MLRGMSTTGYWVADIEAAKAWYSELLGVEPYFAVRTAPDGPVGYYEFRIGDYQAELGLMDASFAPEGSGAGRAGQRLYWHVDDVPAALARLVALGATEYESPVDRGEGFITASVVDPFGNVLGIMFNPHYVAVRDGA